MNHVSFKYQLSSQLWFKKNNMIGRTREQCRKRWYYKLDPDMKHDNWSRDEDVTLLKLQKKLGNKWYI